MVEKIKKITQWSYSRWSCYDQCPRKAKYKYIDGLSEPSNAAMDRGTRIHLLAQHYVEKKLDPLPKELKLFTKQFKNLRAMQNVACELEWGFTKKWEQCEWDVKSTWARIKTDAIAVDQMHALIVDYKTGRIYEGHEKQTGLYALAGFLLHPFVESITTQLWYLDQDATTEHSYSREEVGPIMQVWADRLRPMFNDTQFPAKPNPFCNNCHFRKANLGPCEF